MPPETTQTIHNVVMIIQGNALDIPLADESVDMCVTSPPYYGLRDYGTAKWEGGDAECDHTVSDWNDNLKPHVNRPERDGAKRQFCLKCGAARIDQQLGLEETPEQYIENMVAAFREVKRVLKPHGTLWLNIGDSYNGSGGAGGDYAEGGLKEGQPKYPGRNVNNLKPKDLIGIPWMLAFALRADGWYLRSDIIWHKPNPMPESVRDRPTKAHEYIFLLSKSRRYYYDADAIREKGVIPAGTLAAKGSEERWSIDGVNSRPPEYKEYTGTRNKRTVWTVTTKPYSGAHFATFPPDLIEPCIKAGSSEKGVCPECGKAWERVVEKTRLTRPELPKDDPRYRPNTYKGGYADINGKGDAGYTERKSIGWQPTCDHDHEPVKAKVLDPFMGSGTTLLVARILGRQGIGIELNPEYIKLAEERLELGDSLLNGKPKKVEANHDDMPLFKDIE